jgi:phosphoribosylformylglycinamidine synthase
MDYALEDFRKFTKTIMTKQLLEIIVIQNITQRNSNVFRASLQLEAVACKDWLTNKVDRCVGGKVAKQCAGPLQLPLNNVGVMALDFKGKEGIATSIGHAPISSLIDPVAG